MVRRAFIQHHQKKLLSALKIMNSKLEIIGVEDGNVVKTNFYIYNVPTHENLILNNSRLKRSFEFKHVHLYLRFEFSFTRSLKAKLTLIREFLGPSPSVFSGKKIQNHRW